MNKYKSVEEYIADLDDDKKKMVSKIRGYIQQTSPSLEEHIKWNAPSYMLDKVDRITFNTVNKDGAVKLVFHMDTARKEDKKGTPILNDAPLMEWASDIRGYVTFKNLDYITMNEVVLKRMVSDWLNLK